MAQLTNTPGRSFSTPDRVRVVALVTIAIIAIAGFGAWFASDQLVRDTDRVAESTGEVLILTQQTNASVAEADVSARAVHLAGPDGDPAQRRVYEQALERAGLGLERIARVLGDDDESHNAVAQTLTALARYSGQIEQARAASITGSADAAAVIDSASGLVSNEVLPQMAVVTARAQSRFDEEVASSWFVYGIVALLCAAITVLIGHMWLSKRFRRLLNVPLALSALVLIGLIAFVTLRYSAQQEALDVAQSDAYASIATSDQVQQAAYEFQSGLLTDAPSTSAVDAGAALSAGELSDGRITDLANGAQATEAGLLFDAIRLSDSPGERAASSAVLTRWKRHLESSSSLQQARASGDSDRAIDLARGPVASTFNGFNTAVEAALLDNREQFVASVGDAADALRWLRLSIVAAAVIAAGLAWLGFSLRIREYR